MTETKKFACQADLEEKKVTFSQLSEHAWAYTAEGDPNTGIVIGDDAVLVADTQATPAMARRRDPPHPRGDRQADQVRGADPLPRGARAGRQRLRAAADHRQPGHLRPDRRARRAGQGQRDRPLPAPVPERRDGAAGPDLADHDLHRQDDALAGQARSAAAAARPRPHQGRHGRLAAAGARAAVAATWSSSTPRRMPATPTSRTGRRRSTTSPR